VTEFHDLPLSTTYSSTHLQTTSRAECRVDLDIVDILGFLTLPTYTPTMPFFLVGGGTSPKFSRSWLNVWNRPQRCCRNLRISEVLSWYRRISFVLMLSTI
jgi:hypothetical protein